VHVCGHQDRKVKDSNRRLASLNCQMDALAKQYWVFLFKRLPSLAIPHLPIYNKGWTLWDGPTKITSPRRPTLCGLIMDPVAQMWRVCHKRFPLEAKEAIDWKACSEGMPALKTQPSALDYKACLGQLWSGHHAREMEVPG